MFSAVESRSIRPSVRNRRAHIEAYSRLEVLWALASFVVLILCWDAACRLDERISVPRVRISHALEEERSLGQATTQPLADFE